MDMFSFYSSSCSSTAANALLTITVLYFQLSEWNKNDEKLLKAIEIGDVDKVQSLLQKKTLVPTKLGPRGLSVWVKSICSLQ